MYNININMQQLSLIEFLTLQQKYLNININLKTMVTFNQLKHK